MRISTILKPFFVVLALACFGAAVYFVAPKFATPSNANAKENLVRPVRAVQLTDPALPQKRSFPGTVQASQESKLSFRITGPLCEFPVNIGDYVPKGELIARVDPRDFENHVKRIQAALGSLKANLKAMRRGARKEDYEALLAQKRSFQSNVLTQEAQYKRYQDLLEKKMVPQADYDRVFDAYERAKAALDQIDQEIAKATKGARVEEIEAMQQQIQKLTVDLSDAHNALHDTELRAPFDGFIAQKLTENFETVEIGQPVVVFLDCSVLEVTVGIPEELLTQKDGFQRFECRFDVLPKTVVQGKLKELGRKPNHGSQTYPLTVEFTPPEQCKIQPGMTASLEIFFKSSSETNRFVLPIEAVVASEPETPYVWTVDPAQQTAHKTNVTVGDLSSRGIEIREGLSSGQWVVTAGAHFLEENQRVHLQHSNSQ